MLSIKEIIKESKELLQEPFCSNTFILQKKEIDYILKNMYSPSKKEFIKNKKLINYSVWEAQDRNQINFVTLFHCDNFISGIQKSLNINNLANETRYLAIATFLISKCYNNHKYSARDILRTINGWCLEYLQQTGIPAFVSAENKDLSTIDEICVLF